MPSNSTSGDSEARSAASSAPKKSFYFPKKKDFLHLEKLHGYNECFIICWSHLIVQSQISLSQRQQAFLCHRLVVEFHGFLLKWTETWTNSNYRNVTVNIDDHWHFSSLKSIHLLPLYGSVVSMEGLEPTPAALRWGRGMLWLAHRRASMNKRCISSHIRIYGHFRVAKSPQIQVLGRLWEEATQTRVEYAHCFISLTIRAVKWSDWRPHCSL